MNVLLLPDPTDTSVQSSLVGLGPSFGEYQALTFIH